jgi:hypothetical protein
MRGLRVLLFVFATGAVACADLGSADFGSVPEWSATEELRIGSVDDPESALTSVSVLVEGQDGRVYVGQPQDGHVRIHGADGALLGRLGGEGAGPGEFRSLQGIGWWAGGRDTLWAFDQQLRRVSLFDREGAFVRSIALANEPFRELMRTSVQTILPDGSALGSASYPSYALAAGDIASVPVLRFPLAGGEPRVVVETVPGNGQLAIRVGDGQMYSGQPYGDEAFTILSGEASRVAVVEPPAATEASSAVFRVTMLNAEGDTLWSREYPYQPTPIPTAEIDSVRAARVKRAVDFATRAGGSRADAEEQVREQLYLPVFRPPLVNGRFAEDGSLWLQWSRAPGAATIRWSVLDADGNPAATLELPSNLRPVDVRNDRVWAVETGELGVPYVVRLAVGPADPP